jgi:hypothetical protein
LNISKYAKGYVKRNMAIVPIPAERKSPVLPGWQNLRIGLEEIPRYFNGKPQNIGVLLGEPSGGLVDVDLDVPDAAKIAERFLPKTLASGRKSAPKNRPCTQAGNATFGTETAAPQSRRYRQRSCAGRAGSLPRRRS